MYRFFDTTHTGKQTEAEAARKDGRRRKEAARADTAHQQQAQQTQTEAAEAEADGSTPAHRKQKRGRRSAEALKDSITLCRKRGSAKYTKLEICTSTQRKCYKIKEVICKYRKRERVQAQRKRSAESAISFVKDCMQFVHTGNAHRKV